MGAAKDLAAWVARTTLVGIEEFADFFWPMDATAVQVAAVKRAADAATLLVEREAEEEVGEPVATCTWCWRPFAECQGKHDLSPLFDMMTSAPGDAPVVADGPEPAPPAAATGEGSGHPTSVFGPDADHVEALARNAEIDCNCMSFGDPILDTAYCSVHRTSAPTPDGAVGSSAPVDNPPAAGAEHPETPAQAGSQCGLPSGGGETPTSPAAGHQPPSAQIETGVAPGQGGAPAPSQGGPVESGSGAGHPTFVDWATPAIFEVLAKHTPFELERVGIRCGGQTVLASHETCNDWSEWREHVAPLIAARLEKAGATEPIGWAAASARIAATGESESDFLTGYQAAVDLVGHLAENDARLAESFESRNAGVAQEFKSSADVLANTARYMQAIKPK